MPIIELDHVTKVYPGRRGGRALVGRGGLGDWATGRSAGKHVALSDITFSVERGDSLGIIGANGSGKSTLLKLIAGVTAPTAGVVKVYGRVASLLELGAGFHPMLTGRENVYLNAGLLGMRHAQVDEVFNEIVRFSGIGEFIDNPVDTYSSGMYVRIAFAVAAHTDPDVFLIDEVLSVGDEEFQRRCRARIGELVERGKTIVFVSHDLGIVNSLCRRVVLLSQGRMILRDTARKAIDFYLSQVGAEKGLHTLIAGPLEVVVCNGRISIFYKQTEVTGAAGFEMDVLGLGQWRRSQDAEWEIVERSETGCAARGRLSRAPMLLHWRVRLVDGAVEWTIAVEPEAKTDLDAFRVRFMFSKDYASWHYDDDHGTFPDIEPEDVGGVAVIASELTCEKAALTPKEGSERPQVLLDIEPRAPHLRGHFANADYMTATRVLQIDGHLPGNAQSVAGRVTELLSARIRVGGDEAALREHVGRVGARRTLARGPLKAHFERGCVRLSYDGREVTALLHLYASILIGNLWNDSTNLRWDRFERVGEGLRFGGASRRFPYRLEWTMRLEGEGLAVELYLDAQEDLTVQEHHTTIVLIPGYTRWRTEHEEGAFPDFHPDQTDWRHLNANYAPGRSIEAEGPGLPKVRFETDRDDLRMTPINTGYQQRCRALQALYAPENSLLRFEKGRHAYFAGRVIIG